MKQLLLILSAIVLASCAAVETPITKDNYQIQTPHYSYVVPPDQGWHFSTPPTRRNGFGGEDILLLRKWVDPFMYQIITMKREIPKVFWAEPTKKVADSYRSDQLRKMEILDSAGADLAVRDAVFGEEVLENRKFFTLAYTSVSKTKKVSMKTIAYLLFPKDKNNEWFLFAACSEADLSGDILVNFRKEEFLEILKSVSVSP